MESGSLDLSRIKGIIWDLDNTLYRFNDAFEHACNLASGRAAIEMGVNLTMEEAMVLAEESFYTHGYSGLVFERNFSINSREYHFKYHDCIDETIIERNEDMRQAMAALNLPHVILTNASRPWAHRILEHLGLTQWFPDDRIIAQEDTDFEPKARGPRGFEMGLNILGLPPGNVLMVDDMVKNLKIPKSMGLQTVFISHGKREDIPDYVDVVFSNTLSLMKILTDPDSPAHLHFPALQQAST